MPLPRRARHVLSLLCALAALAGCAPGPGSEAPAIEFTKVPEAAEGGIDRLATIAGRVTGARPGQHVVLYAKSDRWWVQPFANASDTPVGEDGLFENRTHLGTQYAALLVEADHVAVPTVETLPPVGGTVAAVAMTAGSGSYEPPVPRTIGFSGYDWEIRQTSSDRGGSNLYDAANAWTDADGALHLKLARVGDDWRSAEVRLTRALGYGTYLFTVRDTSHLDPASALGLFTWDQEGAEQNHRELDVEISQWGDPSIANAQYVVQPYYVAANVLRFNAPPGRLTHSFRWEPGRVQFATRRGSASTGPTLRAHESTAGIPTPGDERVVLNLYYFRYAPVPPQTDVEVVIERFLYVP